MKAADVMTGLVRTIGRDEAVAVAMDLPSASEARRLPVVNDEGALLGVLATRARGSRAANHLPPPSSPSLGGVRGESGRMPFFASL